MANDIKQTLLTAAQCASLRKVDTDQVDTISKAADMGNLKDERKWPEWYPAFANYQKNPVLNPALSPAHYRKGHQS